MDDEARCLACEVLLRAEQYAESDFCPQCDGLYGRSYCTVCDELVLDEHAGACGHTVYDPDAGISAGVGSEEISADDHREAFWAVLDRCPELADRLRRALRHGRPFGRAQNGAWYMYEDVPAVLSVRAGLGWDDDRRWLLNAKDGSPARIRSSSVSLGLETEF